MRKQRGGAAVATENSGCCDCLRTGKWCDWNRYVGSQNNMMFPNYAQMKQTLYGFANKGRCSFLASGWWKIPIFLYFCPRNILNFHTDETLLTTYSRIVRCSRGTDEGKVAHPIYGGHLMPKGHVFSPHPLVGLVQRGRISTTLSHRCVTM